jgi:membrane peptidoglycan carboxypeptidase
MGVGEVPSVPSLALGSGEVTLQSLTAAYAGFANHGSVPRPMVIRRVEDQDGNVLYRGEASSARVISDTTAFLMSTMLADVVDTGTAAGVRRLGFTLPAAGKTGTTNDFNDAWFVGFTPRLAKFMKIATRDDEPEWFAPPYDVVTARVCRLSGRLATPGCDDVDVITDGHVEKRSMAYTDYFVRGMEPTTYCDLHQQRSLIGKLASLFGGNVEKIEPPRLEDTGLPPVAAPIASTGRVDIAPAHEPERKRGFWSKVFGTGRHDERDARDRKE